MLYILSTSIKKSENPALKIKESIISLVNQLSLLNNTKDEDYLDIQDRVQKKYKII